MKEVQTRDVEFQVGDWVWLRLNHRSAVGITMVGSSKLAPRYYGPFQVSEHIGAISYMLSCRLLLAFTICSMWRSSNHLWVNHRRFPHSYRPLSTAVQSPLQRRS